MPADDAALLARLRSHADFFDSKISLIPVQVYYPPEENTSEKKPNKFLKHKGDKAPKPTKKDKAIEAVEAQVERFSTFDPVNIRTVAYVQKLRAQQQQQDGGDSGDDDGDDDDAGSDDDSGTSQSAAMASKIAKKKLQKTAANAQKKQKKGARGGADEADSDADEDELTSMVDVNNDGPKAKGAKSAFSVATAAADRKLVVAARPVAKVSNQLSNAAPAAASAAVSSSASSSSGNSVMEQLRARLQDKIATMKQQRKSDQQDEAAKSKAVRIEKEKAAGVAGPAAAAASASAKQKRNEQSKKRSADDAGLVDGGDSVQSLLQPQAAAAAAKKGAKPAPAAAAAASAAAPASEADLMSDVIFSTITVNESAISEARKRDKKKSDQKLLKKLETFQEKLDDMTEDEKEGILKDKAMKAALLRAQGVRVRDDPKLLRKTLKREETKKKKSAKIWAERTGAQHAEMKKRAEGRASNVRDRKNIIVAKRLKKNKKTRKD